MEIDARAGYIIHVCACFLLVDVLCSLSGIFRDSFANVLDLLDDLFEKVAVAEGEPVEMNFIKKHVLELQANMHIYVYIHTLLLQRNISLCWILILSHC